MKYITNKNGDTLVEVMIAIVVLGAALGGALAISNSANLTTFNNRERFQALQYASLQIDLIRLKTKDKTAVFTSDVPNAGVGCYKTDGTYSTTDTDCKINNLYMVKTEYTGFVFNIEVTWDSIKGNNSRVELVYAIE